MVHVSVVMAVYNGAGYVGEAVHSVLSQSHSELDLIVVDDGSTDDTATILESIDDPRMVVIRQPNSGVAVARNRGLAEAGGELVAFLDHDDLWFPHKLATQVQRFSDPGVGLVGCFMTYLSDRGPIRAVSGERIEGQRERILAGKLMPFPLSSIVMRTSLARELGGFDADFARVAQVEDLELLTRAARVTKVVGVEEPLGGYRIHGSAASFQKFHKARRGTRFLRDRIAAEQAGRTLTWDEWDANTTPGRAALREDRANFLYRSAGHQMVSGRRVRGVLSLLLATANSPRYVFSRLARQLGAAVRPRSRPDPREAA